MSKSESALQDDQLRKDAVERYLDDDKPSIQGLANELNSTYHNVMAILHKDLDPMVYRKEKSLRYARTKQGNQNPMHGKFRELHHRYKGVIDGYDGYLIILKPDWFTGHPNSNHVPHHQVVFCEYAGMTEIPEGFHVHHIDGDKTNNFISNLALVAISAHRKIHSNSHELGTFNMWEWYEFNLWKQQKEQEE